MQKGFSLPLILIVIFFISLSAVLTSFAIKNTNQSEKVKGVSTETSSKPGLSVSVTSVDGNWELYQYLCKTLEECQKSLTSGTRSDSIGGGSATDQAVTILATPSWKDFKYIKIIVKPSWSSLPRIFRVTTTGNINGTQKDTFTENGNTYEGAIVPLEEISQRFLKSASFSDR